MKTKLLLFLPLSILLVINVSGQNFTKKVLLEEFTTTMCGNCPPKSWDINLWHNSNPNSIIMTIHEGSGVDAMSNQLTNALFTFFRPSWGWFAPAIMIDRTTFPIMKLSNHNDTVPYMIPTKFDSIATAQLSKTAIFGIDISGIYDSTLNKIVATVTTNHNKLPSGTYNVNLFLVEDSVTGTGFPAYDQDCYDATFASTNFGSYPYVSNRIIGYPHRHVIRMNLLGGYWGRNISLTGNIDTFNCNVTIPSTYNKKRLSLVASVNSYDAVDKSTNYVLNANEIKLKPAYTTSINNIEKISVNNIYPNPASAYTNLTYTLADQENVQISITDIFGQTYQAQPSKKMDQGTHEIKIDTENLPKGIYIVTLKTQNSINTLKFIKD